MTAEDQWALAQGIAALLQEQDGKPWVGIHLGGEEQQIAISWLMRGWFLASLYSPDSLCVGLYDARSNHICECHLADPESIDQIVRELLDLTHDFNPTEDGTGKPPWPPLRPDAGSPICPD